MNTYLAYSSMYIFKIFKQMNRLKEGWTLMEVLKHIVEEDWAKHARVLFTSSLTSDVGFTELFLSHCLYPSRLLKTTNT